MGDTMLGDGTCRRCRRGYQHVCENRQEVGVRGGRPGALAEQLAVPVTSLHALPDSVDSVLGALVEPGGNAFRAAQAAALAPGDRALVLGPGTIGLLVAMFARAAGAEVHLMGRSEESLAFARSLGFEHVWTEDNLPGLPFDAVIDASNAAHLPALALDLVEPAGRVVYIGLAGSESHIDTRTLALKDVTAVGILSGLSWPRRHHRGVRERCRRSPAARRRHRRPRAGRRRARGGTAGGGRPRPEDPCRSTAQLKGF